MKNTIKKAEIELIPIEQDSIDELNLNFILKKNSRMEKFKIFFTQIFLLMRKNYLIYQRNWKVSLFQLLSPLLIFLLLLFFQNIANNVTEVNEVNPPISQLSKIPKCFGPENDRKNCISVGYGIIV